MAATEAREAAHFPERLHVEVTSACNQTCRFCPHAEMQRTKRHMRFELFERIAEEAGRHGSRLWLHFLGEPLSHPRIFDMVRSAKAAGAAAVGFSTNGVLLTPERLDDLFASGLDRLEISIDASDRERYRSMRGCDDFDVVVANTRAFLAEKRRRNASAPVVTLGFLDAGHESSERAAFEAEWRPRLDGRDFLMAIPAITFGGRVDAPAERAVRRPCEWLFGAALVLSNGDVVACASDYEGERVFGNVLSASIESIWTDPEYEELRKRHREARYGGLALCESCTDWSHADGHGYVNFAAAEVG